MKTINMTPGTVSCDVGKQISVCVNSSCFASTEQFQGVLFLGEELEGIHLKCTHLTLCVSSFRAVYSYWLTRKGSKSFITLWLLI